jgi:succinylarginine dihydrolase
MNTAATAQERTSAKGQSAVLTEVNVDRIVAPTHHYGGLGVANRAAWRNRHLVSSPRAAALQCIRKMRLAAGAGAVQLALPPSPRPDQAALSRMGVDPSQVADDDDVCELVAASSSSASMWVANSATFTSSIEAADGRPHLTPANLVSSFHRAVEVEHTTRLLRQVFDPAKFVHHLPLPASMAVRDEGAANHLCLARSPSHRGVNLFVFGARVFGQPSPVDLVSARQTLEASAAIARLHRLEPQRTVFAQKSRQAMAAGAFHADLVMLACGEILFLHEDALEDRDSVQAELARKYGEATGRQLHLLPVPRSMLTLEQAIDSYVFNSQVVEGDSGRRLLIAPTQVDRIPAARQALEMLIEHPASALDELHLVDLTESMNNGGGPACLRLRLTLTPTEVASLPPGTTIDDERCEELEAWIERTYRSELSIEDLGSPALIGECVRAHAGIAEIFEQRY